MLVFIAIISVFCFLGGIIYFSTSQLSIKSIASYEDCVNAGYPILESYPEQCMTPDGRSFTRELTDEEKRRLEEAEKEAYYGSYTSGPCETNNDCIVSGCNNEICQSKNEDPLSSICLVTEDPPPQELGYECQCVENKCEWNK